MNYYLFNMMSDTDSSNDRAPVLLNTLRTGWLLSDRQEPEMLSLLKYDHSYFYIPLNDIFGITCIHNTSHIILYLRGGVHFKIYIELPSEINAISDRALGRT